MFRLNKSGFINKQSICINVSFSFTVYLIKHSLAPIYLIKSRNTN